MAITYNSQEAKLEKKPTTYQGFTYDTETDGGCLNKFEEVSKLILEVSNDVEELGNKYTSLQAKYDKFTDFNDKMNSNKNSLRNSVDNIKKCFDNIIQNLNKQVTALQETDASLMTDLESIAKLISNSKDQDKTISDSRNKNDSSSSSSGKSDEDKAKAVNDVISGKYGTGDERKEALRKAGFDPNEIQKMVNDKLNGGGSSSNSGKTESNSSETSQSERPDAPKDGTEEAGYVPTGADEHPGTSNGPVLNSTNGRIQGPSGEETYYNLDMSKIVAQSQPGGWVYNDAKAHGNEGNLSSNYWVREDGCKMMGDYIMVAADLNVHPRGSIVQTSLGPGIVVDTGDFAKTNHNQLDIATTW